MDINGYPSLMVSGPWPPAPGDCFNPSIAHQVLPALIWSSAARWGYIGAIGCAVARAAAMSDPGYKLGEVNNRAERRRAERLGLALPSAQTRCRIELDGWDPEIAKFVWSDSRPEALQRGFIELAELLHQLVDDPNAVTLVIPADFAEAVQRRQPGVPYALERGSGLVGGRTMPMGSERIDVLINAGPLLAFDENNAPILDREPMSLICRTVVHEAQHAVMHTSVGRRITTSNP